ncbi:MAG: DUF2207 domain-containing protein [Candidatus Pacearchaeota archaeon]|jgi:uncharacterized membrane protein
MKEINKLIIISIILILAGILLGTLSINFVYSIITGKISNNYNEFNFYSAHLDINGAIINEKLYFNPDEDYHTLFRDFETNIYSKDNFDKDTISILNVSCKTGKSYFKTEDYCYSEPDFSKKNICFDYTENNEYGCTFGNDFGFFPDNTYIIESTYRLNPKTIFNIKNKNYIKFIPYAKNRHVDLNKDSTLFIKGEHISISNYNSKDYVIIYIPYEGNTSNLEIIIQDDFEFDELSKKRIFIAILISLIVFLLHLIPFILLIYFWKKYGKENYETDIPDQLSDYPVKRKPWEVAAFFNHPFGDINNNFFSTMIFDFYRRKIIDIKIIDKILKDKFLVKLNNEPSNLDQIEKKFYKILKKLKESDKSISSDNYFDINSPSRSYSEKKEISDLFDELKDLIKKESKKYINKKGSDGFFGWMVLLTIFSFVTFLIPLLILSIFSIILVALFSYKNPFLIRYNEDYYIEYKKWQSFKKWLSYSLTIKKSSHKGVILWEEYLVYGSALGVAKQVLKELNNQGIIDIKTMKTFSNMNTSITNFAVSSRASHSSHSSGGFSGSGSGGMGGGGGGGR